jgi:two-component system, OmpR family, sensor histidine kinase TctE
VTFAGRSLYTRLALRVALVLGSSGLVLLAAVVFFTRLAANEAYDRILTGSALQVAENTWYENGRVNVDIPVSTFAMLTASDQVFYAVLDPAGHVVAGDAELKADIPYARLKDGPLVLQGSYAELPVSIAIVGRRLPVEGANPWAVILLAQTNHARHAVATTLGLNTSMLILAMGVLTVLAALWTLRQALEPLKQIAHTMDGRSSGDLSPLTQVVPTEIQSLVSAINDFMHRLQVHRSMLRGVIGDAAHQLRTPVAALLSQMELLQLHAHQASRDQHLSRAQVLARNLGELVNQLINHAMVQFRAEAVPLQSLDLAVLARETMADKLSHPAHQHLDLGFQAPEGPCRIRGDATALREALKNVLDNALQYGAQTLLHMELRRTPQTWELRVVDDGPGIAEAAWDAVRQPFSARSGNRDGASLGLAIAQEVMRAHQGSLQFSWNAAQHFVVSLHFPAPAQAVSD